ncbi:MAG: thermonuclease family protein [Solirubrobacterales bacterium]
MPWPENTSDPDGRATLFLKARRWLAIAIACLTVALAAFTIFIAIVITSLFAPSRLAGTYCTGAHAIDGGTLDVGRDCFEITDRLRLVGVEAPGLSQCGGAAAKMELERVVGNREIYTPTEELTRLDKSGRGVMTVFVGERSERDVGLYMIRNGFVRSGHYQGLPKGHLRYYDQAEALARRDHRGIWRECPR